MIPLPYRLNTVRDPNHAGALPPSFVSFMSFVVRVGTNRLSLTSAAMLEVQSGAAAPHSKTRSVLPGPWAVIPFWHLRAL
jgi:hypothetical protein